MPRAMPLLPLHHRLLCSPDNQHQIAARDQWQLPASDFSSNSPQELTWLPSSSTWGLTWLPAVCTQRVLRSSPHLLQGLHDPLIASSHHLEMLSLQADQGRAGRAAAFTFCTRGPARWARRELLASSLAQGGRSHQRDRCSGRFREKGEAGEAVKSMEGV